MEQLTKIVSEINGFLWGMYCLIPLLCGVGIYFTLKLDFIQIRRFGLAVKSTFGGLTLHGERAGKQGMSSFQSLATAIAAQVGTGNLAGAATAIAMGGPGAIFWMWIAAFFGMATIFAEAVLAQTYKTTDDQGHVTGGPAYYISKGLGSKKLAAFFSISIIIALGFIGNMVQANSIADAFQTALFPASAAHRRNHLRARRVHCSSAAWGACRLYRKGRPSWRPSTCSAGLSSCWPTPPTSSRL
ncbi:MAG: alanine:cation symporter family protein [Bilophila wadsworthia]